jgi:zinc protease
MSIALTRRTLANGLRVVVAPDRRSPAVAVNLWYGVGSRNEPPGKTGFAHLFEHMMFQGSENVPEASHIAHVQRVGGSVNGSTWLDRTNYFETVPAHHLDLALWLESDRLGFLLPAMTEEKFENQRSVVKNERRQRVDNQPYGDWDERLQALMYPSEHPYHHSVIGSMADLDAATLDDATTFFERYYHPGNAVLTLCGDVDSADGIARVERWFGEIPEGPPVPPLPGTPELPPMLGGERRDEVVGDVPLPRLFLAYRIPRYGDDAFPALDMAAHLLADGKASLLYRTLVRERRLASSVGAFAFPIVTGAAMLLVSATALPGVDPETLEAETVALVEGMGDAVDLESELARAATRFRSRWEIGLQGLAHRADLISMFTMLFDDPDRINREADLYGAVTAADIEAAAGRFLRPGNRGVLSYRPSGGAG